MSKFSGSNTVTKPSKPKFGKGPLKTKTNVVKAPTFEGGQGYVKGDKTALYTLAVTNMVGEPTFYESGPGRDNRFRDLVRKVTQKDPVWISNFIPFLRDTANMRSASIVVAVEAAVMIGEMQRQGTDPGVSVRGIISSACSRADEPAEVLGYYLANYGRKIPMGIKRGIADAANRLYNERCVSPDTLVLTRSLEWIPAGQLQEGDELVGFDEEVRGVGRGHSAKMNVAFVTSVGRVLLPTVKITTDKGQTKVSTDHRVVVRSETRNREWRRAADLKPGDKLIWFGTPWATDRSYEAGWIAGFLDGEGWVAQKRVSVAQNLGDTLDSAKECFKHLGFELHVGSTEAKANRQAAETLTVAGGRYESMRLLGMVGSVRLDKDSLWVGSEIVSKGPHVEVGNAYATVVSVQQLGQCENVTMGTSTKTFIGDGFLSHNSVLKYDGGDRGVRMGDVVELTHPKPEAGWQSSLYKHVLDRRHGHVESIPEDLRTIVANEALKNVPASERRALLTARGNEALAEAGYTWEILSGWLPGGMDAQAWASIIPSMGYMGLLRNLRNFEQAGVDRKVLKFVRDKLEDPAEVARCRQFPYRFWSAYKNSGSIFFAPAIEEALRLSCANIPELPGRTLVLIDTSGSMDAPVSGRSDIQRWEAAALFGAAMQARMKDVTLVAYGTNWEPVKTEVSILRTVENLRARLGKVGHGTNTWPSALGAIQEFGPFDRIFAFTDMQDAPPRGRFGYQAYRPSPGETGKAGIAGVLPDVPIYSWDLAGYANANVNTNIPGQYLLGGFSDASFKLPPLLEAGQNAAWPWNT